MRPKTFKWLLVLPTLIFFFVLVVYPIFRLYYTSLFYWEVVLDIRRFVGVENYVDLATDDRFLYSLRFTAGIVGAAIILEFAAGFILAYILSSVKFPGKSIVIVLLFLPMTISQTVVGYTARMAFSPMYGFVNHLLGSMFQMPVEIDWLTIPFWSGLMIIIVDFWQWMPFLFIAIYTALTVLPDAPREAALIDGANSLQIVRYIQLPMLKTTIMAIVILRAMDAFKLFEYILLTTSGGPGYLTESISFYLYRIIFRLSELGYGSAVSVIYFLLAGILITIFYRIAREEIA